MIRAARACHPTRRLAADRRGGFTLVELLVVMTILGVLAAIAIPVFLSQRTKSYVAALEADLRNAATSNEGWATEHDGAYVSPGASAATTLAAEGYHPSTGVTLTVVDDHMAGAGGGFCLRAVHDRLGPTRPLYFASNGPTAGKPTDTPCTAS